jgi:predicted dienelactone hydrolase
MNRGNFVLACGEENDMRNPLKKAHEDAMNKFFRFVPSICLAICLAFVVAQFLLAFAAGQNAQTNAVDLGYTAEDGALAVETVSELTLKDTKRNKEVPVKIYYPATGGNYPVIVFSHGGGGSKDNYQTFGRFWASHGYVVIHPTHDDSIALLRKRASVSDWREPLRKMANDPKVWESRPRDVSFVIDSLAGIEGLAPPLKGKMNRNVIGVGGHSFGAYTSMLIGGATIDIPNGPKKQSYADRRVRAIVVLSGQGRGQQGMTGGSWDKLSLPMLNVTGSEDRSMMNITSAPGQSGSDWKQEPFRFCPPGDKYQLFVEGMDHGLGGAGGGNAGLFRENPAHVRYLKSATLAFLNAYLKNDKQAGAWLRSDKIGNSAVRWERR